MNADKRSIGSTLALVALAVILALAGCQSQPTPAPTQVPVAAQPAQAPAAVPTQAPAPAQPTMAPSPTAVPKMLKMGIESWLTGLPAHYGIQIDRWFRMALDDTNAKGGLRVGSDTYQLQAVTVDDKYTSEGGLEAANRLALAEKVKFVLGSVSVTLNGGQPVYEANKVLHISPQVNANQMGPAHPFTLSGGWGADEMRDPALYAVVAKANPQAKRVAVVGPDVSAAHALADLADTAAKDLGLTVVTKQFFPADIKDLHPFVLRLLRENFDLLDVTNTGSFRGQMVPLVQALYEQGYRKPIFGTSADVAGLSTAGPAIDGFTFVSLDDWRSSVVPQTTRDSITRFIQKYGEEGLEPSLQPAYDAASVLLQGIAKAGAVDDALKVADTLRAGEWETAAGKVHFVGTKTYGAPSAIEELLYLSKIQGGKATTLATIKGTLP